MALEHSFPFGAQLLVAERRLCVDSARGVLSDYEVEKLVHYFGSPPAEIENWFLFVTFNVCGKTWSNMVSKKIWKNLPTD